MHDWQDEDQLLYFHSNGTAAVRSRCYECVFFFTVCWQRLLAVTDSWPKSGKPEHICNMNHKRRILTPMSFGIGLGISTPRHHSGLWNDQFRYKEINYATPWHPLSNCWCIYYCDIWHSICALRFADWLDCISRASRHWQCRRWHCTTLWLRHRSWCLAIGVGRRLSRKVSATLTCIVGWSGE